MDLWDDDHVDITRCEGCIASDNTTIPTHYSNHTDAVLGGLAFDVGWIDKWDRLLDNGAEPEASVDDWHVVVDRAWKAHDLDSHISLFSLMLQNF